MGRPSRALVRRGLLVALVLLTSATWADARGGGGGMGGGGKRGGKKGSRAGAQVEQLINEAYRRDVFARSRRVDG